MHKTPLIFLVAGEASGDYLGARLMAALKAKTSGNVQFVGIGGPRMKAEGLDLLFDQSELSHMGLFAV
ncbi:MAG: lipid-A-disaccharide synthase, partial [Bdellovibrionales bacterium]